MNFTLNFTPKQYRTSHFAIPAISFFCWTSTWNFLDEYSYTILSGWYPSYCYFKPWKIFVVIATGDCAKVWPRSMYLHASMHRLFEVNKWGVQKLCLSAKVCAKKYVNILNVDIILLCRTLYVTQSNKSNHSNACTLYIFDIREIPNLLASIQQRVHLPC